MDGWEGCVQHPNGSLLIRYALAGLELTIRIGSCLTATLGSNSARHLGVASAFHLPRRPGSWTQIDGSHPFPVAHTDARHA